MSTSEKSPAPRVERILAYMLAGLIIVSIVSFLSIIFGTLAGVGQEQFATGIWPMVTVFPLIGLPMAMLLLIALVVVSYRRRAKEAPKP